MVRGLARLLFALCSAVSLVLCVAACALWARSHSGIDTLRFVRGSHGWEFDVGGGSFTFQWQVSEILRGRKAIGGISRIEGPAMVAAHDAWRRSVASPQNPWTQQPARPSRLGVWWGTQREPGAAPGSPWAFILVAPMWPVALLLLVLPGTWVAGRVRARRRGVRRARGLCPSCGYDLRASPARCPECGTQAAGGAASTGRATS